MSSTGESCRDDVVSSSDSDCETSLDGFIADDEASDDDDDDDEGSVPSKKRRMTGTAKPKSKWEVDSDDSDDEEHLK